MADFDLSQLLGSMLGHMKEDWGNFTRGGPMTPEEEAEELARQEMEKERIWQERLKAVPQIVQPPADTRGTGMPGQDYVSEYPSQHPMGAADEMYVPQAVEPAYSEDGLAADEIWRRFQEMNPGVTDDSPSYDESFIGPPALSIRDRIAQQSGGNVPGGTFSQMPDTRPEAQSDKAFYAFVDKLKQQNRMDEALDPRANTYDPEMARAMLTHEAATGRNAADELYSRAQMMGAEAESKDMALARKRMEMMSSPEGKLNSTVDFILQNVDPALNRDIFDKALRARVALNRGNTREAEKILMEIQGNVGGMQAGANETGQPVIG